MGQPIWTSRQSQTTSRRRRFSPWLTSSLHVQKPFWECPIPSPACGRGRKGFIAAKVLESASLGLKCVESGLGAGNVLLYRAATHPDTTDYFVAYSDRQSTTEEGDTWDMGHTGEKGRIVLDEVVKVLRGHAEERGVGLVLCHLDADQRCAVHAAEGLEQAAFIEDRYHLRYPQR